MKKTICLILLFPSLIFARTLRIAVIDSGLTEVKGVKLCKEGIIDLTRTNTKSEYYKHGDNITHIISDALGDLDYCIVHIKAFSEHTNYYFASADAFSFALNLNVDIINYSAGGLLYSKLEAKWISLALKKGIKVIVAAGNERIDLDKKCNYYPACIQGVALVGNIDNVYSNYGKRVTAWRNGNNIKAGGTTLSGTSQACALYTRDLALKMIKEMK